MNATIDHANQGRRRDAFRLIWRWHFYAGLFCLPFILWLASTGMIYLFRPQIEPLLEQRFAHVAKGPLHAPSAQVAAALRAVPGGVLNAYELPGTPDAATRVLVGRGPELIRVFVNPSDLRVLHVVRDKDRFMRVIFYLHGELLLGDRGSMLVELAASWTILMLLSGLYLWWPRGGRVAGVLYPRTGQGKRVFWRDIHAVTGVWVSLFALFLLTSGLPWTKSWGGMLSAVRHTYAASAAPQDWTTGSSSEIAQRVAMNTPVDEHAGHAGMSDMGGMSMMPMGVDYTPLDRLVSTVSAQQLPAPVLISPPSKRTPQWSAHSDTANRPLRVDLLLDGASGRIVSRADFAQKPLLDRIIAYGVAIHEGQLFGPLNQAFGVFTALGMITLAVSSIVMWWRRRPVGVLGAPPAHADMRYPRVFVGLLVVLGVLLPLLGATMLFVLVLERFVLRRFHRARHFLGLAAER
jgi:uncharacterized iron-regulated membrane protein